MTVVKIVPMPGPQGPQGPQGPSGTANTGDITFNGVDIIGAGTASGDGYGNGTINLVPDASLKSNDQYLIIDPTAPNHIHIRAGGTQDDSIAQLIFGGERANLTVTDYNHQVSIQSYNTETDSAYYWNFGNDGVLSGPGMGNVIIQGLSGSEGNDLAIFASEDLKIYNFEVSDMPVGYRYTPQTIINSTGNIASNINHLGKQLYNVSNGEAKYIVPRADTTLFPIGTEIKFINNSTSYWAFEREDSTVNLFAEGQNYTNQNIVFYLPADGFATLIKVESNRWLLTGIRVND